MLSLPSSWPSVCFPHGMSPMLQKKKKPGKVLMANENTQ